jgi:hypothetical protein
VAKKWKPGLAARAIATLLSRSIAISIVALGGARARAQDAAPPPSPPPPYPSEVAQPAPAYPPPPVYPPGVTQPIPAYPPPPPPPPEPSGFERRHQVGAQIGGTGILQFLYRFRAGGPLHLEAGTFGAPHGLNASAGIVLGLPVANRWFPYLGFGGGFMGGGGPAPNGGCDPATTTCPEKTADAFPFLHARVGIGVAFGATRRHLVSLDAGGWYGKDYERWNDTAGQTVRSSKTVALPMAGLSYLFAL